MKLIFYILTLGIGKWLELDKKLEIHIQSSRDFKERMLEKVDSLDKHIDKRFDDIKDLINKGDK